MEELLRLIRNFEYDRQKSGLLDDETRYFLEDIGKIANEGIESVRSAYERGKEEGYGEGYREGRDDEQENNDNKLYNIGDIVLNALSEGGTFCKHQALNKIAKLIDPYHKDFPE